LRNELCSNNLNDFGLKKGLDHLQAVREKFQTITGRFASFQAQWLNVHVDFPLLQRIALPITIGSVRYPGIKIHAQRHNLRIEASCLSFGAGAGWTAVTGRSGHGRYGKERAFHERDNAHEPCRIWLVRGGNAPVV
jgi:hypothetical protein